MLADGYGQRAGLPASAPNSLLRGCLARDQVKVDKIAIRPRLEPERLLGGTLARCQISRSGCQTSREIINANSLIRHHARRDQRWTILCCDCFRSATESVRPERTPGRVDSVAGTVGNVLATATAAVEARLANRSQRTEDRRPRSWRATGTDKEPPGSLFGGAGWRG